MLRYFFIFLQFLNGIYCVTEKCIIETTDNQLECTTKEFHISFMRTVTGCDCSNLGITKIDKIIKCVLANSPTGIEAISIGSLIIHNICSYKL